MKMVILAGGHKSTISDEYVGMPKPMLPIGGRPLLWHIMKHASECGIHEFVVCGGYKVEQIKEYFLDFYIYQSDIQINTATNTVKILNNTTENWDVTVVDTGIESLPIERIKKVLNLAGDEFLITYGDCLSDISLEDMISFHRDEKREMTVAVARPSGRKVPLQYMVGNDENWKSNEAAFTSAGLFVAKKSAFENSAVGGDIEDLLSETPTSVYKHEGFFSSIETLRDKSSAEELWSKGCAPWIGTL